jgi:hypothetical protein
VAKACSIWPAVPDASSVMWLAATDETFRPAARSVRVTAATCAAVAPKRLANCETVR